MKHATAIYYIEPGYTDPCAIIAPANVITKIERYLESMSEYHYAWYNEREDCWVIKDTKNPWYTCIKGLLTLRDTKLVVSARIQTKEV